MIKGVYTALITPFTDKGELDQEGLKENLHRQIEAGVDGVLVLGTTGESATLTDAEKESVITTSKKCCKDRLSLMVGVGTNCTRQTVDAAKRAKRLGADSLLVVVPYYNCPEPEGVIEHIKSVAQAVSVPICLYYHPKRTGCTLSLDTIIQLAHIPGVKGIKDASDSLELIDAIAQETVHLSSFSIFCGNDSATLPGMALGADGVISVISNLFPQEVVSLQRAAIQGNLSAARRWHRELAPLVRLAFLESNPLCIKAMMRFAGYAAGSCRLPLTTPRLKTLEEIQRGMRSFEKKESWHVNEQEALV